MYMFTLNIIIVCYEDPQKSSDILNKPQYHAWRGYDRLPVSPHTLHIIVDEHGSRSYSGYWQPERIPQPYIYSCVPCISTIPTRPSRLISLSTMGGGVQSCCCLPTPLTLVCGGSPIIPLLVHHPAYLSIWPAAPSLQRGLSTNPGVTVWCVCGCS